MTVTHNYGTDYRLYWSGSSLDLAVNLRGESADFTEDMFCNVVTQRKLYSLDSKY